MDDNWYRNKSWSEAIERAFNELALWRTRKGGLQSDN